MTPTDSHVSFLSALLSLVSLSVIPFIVTKPPRRLPPLPTPSAKAMEEAKV
jgi:hypothetical protein